MDFDEIKHYWDDRAAEDSSAQSTTQDFYLREIESNALSERIRRYLPATVADVGCGDGRTTTRLAAIFPNTFFFGFDYSPSMVENAKRVRVAQQTTNVEFEKLDICDDLNTSFDLIYSTRCLINLPSWELQQVAMENIHKALHIGGVYLMVENFIEGQDNFNQIRRTFGLPEIPVREHNLFFERARFREFVDGRFEIEDDVNISSTYYLVSRVIYSKICLEAGRKPDYFDDHHRYAAALPYSGEFGPVRLFGLKKR